MVQIKNPEGVIRALRKGNNPPEGGDWLLTGHKEFRQQIGHLLDEIKSGRLRSEFRIVEGAPGSGKTNLLNLAGRIAVAKGFAFAQLKVSPVGGEFTDKKYLVPKICREIKAPGTAHPCDLERVIEKFATTTLSSLPPRDAPQDYVERAEKISAKVVRTLEGFEVPEKSVVDVIIRAVNAIDQGNQRLLRMCVEWFYGESLTMGDVRDVGAFVRINEQTALPILESVGALLRANGNPGLVLLIDEMVQFLDERRETQRARTKELVRLLHDGEISRTLIVVGATPETIRDSADGLVSSKALESRLFGQTGGNPDLLNPDDTIYTLAPIQRPDARILWRKIVEVYGLAYKELFIDQSEAGVVEELCPEPGVLPRDFVKKAVRKLDMARRGI